MKVSEEKFIETVCKVKLVPYSMEDIAKELRMAKSYVRERIHKLIETGKLKRNGKLLVKVGKPSDYYFDYRYDGTE